jgi:hypothetical protein
MIFFFIKIPFFGSPGDVTVEQHSLNDDTVGHSIFSAFAAFAALALPA